MARAKAYDAWEDPGMVFSEDDVKNYSPLDTAERRMDELIELHNVLNALSLLGYGPSEWAGSYSKRVKLAVTGLCVSVKMAQPDPSDFDERGLPEYMAVAQKMRNWYKWADGLANDCDLYMAKIVTLGRRAAGAQGWKKQEHSVANKFANRINEQRYVFQQYAMELRSYNLKTDHPGMEPPGEDEPLEFGEE